MAWYNPWSGDRPDKSGQSSSSSAAAAGTSTATDVTNAAPISEPSSTSRLSSAVDRQRQSHPLLPHNAIESSPELFRHEPSSSTRDGALPTSLSATQFLSSLSPTIPLTAFGIGLVSGIFTTANQAGLVFLAENAHRKPTTMQGWYFYNKTKNYRVLWAATKGGLKGGIRLGLWSSLFTVIEGGSLYYRTSHNAQQSQSSIPSEYTAIKRLGHWTDGMLAGQGVGTAASIVYKTSPVRFFMLGSVAGTITGLLQDIRDELIWREQRQDHNPDQKNVQVRTEPIDKQKETK
ncbi:unnamed protein product [Sympodiomycopsis kandeliae]